MHVSMRYIECKSVHLRVFPRNDRNDENIGKRESCRRDEKKCAVQCSMWYRYWYVAYRMLEVSALHPPPITATATKPNVM